MFFSNFSKQMITLSGNGDYSIVTKLLIHYLAVINF